MTVEFKFETDQMVTTLLGDIGIVGTCAIDDGGVICYHVKTSGSSDWHKEKNLKLCPQEK